MTPELAIDPDHLAIVKDILSRHLPEGFRAHVFGSRATKVRLKPWSDLDLLVEGPRPLDTRTRATLSDAFDWSRLPWKVDLVDRQTVSEEFGAIVDRTKVALTL